MLISLKLKTNSIIVYVVISINNDKSKLLNFFKTAIFFDIFCVVYIF